MAKQLTLNAVLLGIVASLPNRLTDNNYLTDEKGKILKSAGKDIYLWNDEMFHQPLDSFFCFNPFQELITHEESPSFSYLVRMVNINLNTTLMAAIPALLTAITKLKTPNKRQLALMDGDFTKVDAKTVTAIEKIFGEVKLNSRNRSLVDISAHNRHPITRDVDGWKYAAVKFPLLTELAFTTPKKGVFGVTGISKVNIEILNSVLMMLVPEETESGCYLVRNKHTCIPHNRALHDAYSDLIDRINHVLSTFNITSVDVPEIHDDWTKGLTSMRNLLGGIPRDVYGTIGKVRSGSEDEAANEVVGAKLIGAGNNGASGYGGMMPQGPLGYGGANRQPPMTYGHMGAVFPGDMNGMAYYGQPRPAHGMFYGNPGNAQRLLAGSGANNLWATAETQVANGQSALAQYRDTLNK